MRLLFLFALTACQVGDNLAALEGSPDAAGEVSIFSTCQDGLGCETGICKPLDQEDTASVCTIECLSHSDCQAENINAFCICDFTEDSICWVNVPGHEDTPRHCLLACNPLAEEDECEEGLSCEVVSFSIDPPSIRWACRPPYED